MMRNGGTSAAVSTTKNCQFSYQCAWVGPQIATERGLHSRFRPPETVLGAQEIFTKFIICI
jgi:hypothetical protein